MKRKFSLSYIALSTTLACLTVMPLHANTVSNIYSGPADSKRQINDANN